jgi:hypothetical protein
MNSEELRQLKDKGPYDDALELNMSMYDKIPYIRDISLCSQENLILHSGNVIKYYQYKLINVYVINTEDNKK